MSRFFRRRETPRFEPEFTEMRESFREIGYILYRDTPLGWLVRKLRMEPKHWIREREERDASNTESERS